MNHTNNQDYDPADDDNQGVVRLMAQGEEANAGIAQAEYMNPVTAQGPEPEKEEVNEDGVNDDLLTEEEVEDGDVDLEDEEE